VYLDGRGIKRIELVPVEKKKICTFSFHLKGVQKFQNVKIEFLVTGNLTGNWKEKKNLGTKSCTGNDTLQLQQVSDSPKGQLLNLG
jgi:hypothetical protein